MNENKDETIGDQQKEIENKDVTIGDQQKEIDEHIKKIHALQAYIKEGRKMCKETVSNMQADLDAKEKENRQLKYKLKSLGARE